VGIQLVGRFGDDALVLAAAAAAERRLGLAGVAA
jgi:Asp-tRNA(Asn)/Glu-tRNA(Gln) amidotransferase A subunit family amidase